MFLTFKLNRPLQWVGLVRAVFVMVLAIIAPVVAHAHVLKTTDAIIYFNADATKFGFQLDMNLEAMLAGIDPEAQNTQDTPQAEEYNRLRSLPPAELQKLFDAQRDQFEKDIRLVFDGQPVPVKISKETFREVGDLSRARNTTIEIGGDIPPGAKTFQFGWDERMGKATLRTISVRSKSMHIEEVGRGELSTPLVIDDIKARTIWNMIADFIVVGYEHIVPKGLDHILFVAGIYLLSTNIRPILTQVTAFTVAHTVTLGLGAAGIVNFPSSIVEPLIAASIIYVGVENILRPTLSPWRPVVVFCFGLLHGMGFAGILKSFNLPPGDFVTGLISFNVGVELGQLTVILACVLLFGMWFGKKPWYRQRVVIPLSLVISAIATFWFVERVGWI